VGTPIPPEADYSDGSPCPDCFGPGKPFGDIPTPKKIQITFEGIEPANCNCTEHNEPPVPAITSPLILWVTQTDSDPCWWTYNHPVHDWGWWCSLWYYSTTGKSYLQLGRKILYNDCNGQPHTYSYALFYDWSQPICSTFFDNNDYIDNCYIGPNGVGGQATLYWPGMP